MTTSFRPGVILSKDPEGHLVSLQVDGATIIARATLPEVQCLTVAQLILLAKQSPAPVSTFAIELDSAKFEHADVHIDDELFVALKEMSADDTVGLCERSMQLMTAVCLVGAKRGPTPRNYKFVFKVQKINCYVDAAGSATFEFTIVTKPEDKNIK